MQVIQWKHYLALLLLQSGRFSQGRRQVVGVAKGVYRGLRGDDSNTIETLPSSAPISITVR